MRKSRFSEEQMVKMVRECDHLPVADVAKKHGVSEQTIYAWRKQFGSMEAIDAKRLKALEAENACLNKLLAERDLEVEVAKEIAAKTVSVVARNLQVAYARNTVARPQSSSKHSVCITTQSDCTHRSATSHPKIFDHPRISS